MITVGYFIGIFASGYFSFKYNHQKTIVISCFACGLSLLLVSLSQNILFLRLSLIVVGSTAGLYLPAGIASLTYRLSYKDFGKAFSFHEISPSLGFILGPLLAEFILRWTSWRAALLPISLFLFIMGVIYTYKGSTGDYKGQPPSLKNLASILVMSNFWFMLVIFMLGVGANVGLYSMLPLYLQAERGMDHTFTNFILSGSRVAAMLSPFIAGWATQRFGPKPVVAFIFVLNGIATVLLGQAKTDWLVLPIFVQPLLAAAFFPPAFTILTSIVRSDFRNLIISLVMPLSMLLGGGALPTMIGFFGDMHMFFVGFTLIGILLIVSTTLLHFLHVPSPSQS